MFLYISFYLFEFIIFFFIFNRTKLLYKKCVVFTSWEKEKINFLGVFQLLFFKLKSQFVRVDPDPDSYAKFGSGSSNAAHRDPLRICSENPASVHYVRDETGSIVIKQCHSVHMCSNPENLTSDARFFLFVSHKVPSKCHNTSVVDPDPKGL